jgi:hypothetical protein
MRLPKTACIDSVVSLALVQLLRLSLFFQRAFQDVSPEEQRQMEEVLKRIGRRAEELGEQERHR